jgi:hypothetical protein
MINIYDIDYTKAVQWLIPNWLRQSVMVSWLGALVRPHVWLYQAFLRYRTAKLYQLMITPQVCYMERLLNDRFDNIERRIYIDDGITYTPAYIYLESEDKPLWLYTEGESEPIFLFTEGETVATETNDFVVYVPAGLEFNTDEMKALINSYKLAGKLYKIQFYE